MGALKLQRLLDVGNQIIGAFQTAGIANQIAADAGGDELGIVHLAVGGTGGVQAAGGAPGRRAYRSLY